MGLDLKDKVIVFDEAHNVESFSENAFSHELLKDDFISTIKHK